jgi:hypothetical protein
MVGDFRILNQKTISDEFAIPDLLKISESLGLSFVYSILDLLKASHQIMNTYSAQEQLTLATKIGNFQYLVTPFGPKNTHATFAKLI